MLSIRTKERDRLLASVRACLVLFVATLQAADAQPRGAVENAPATQVDDYVILWRRVPNNFHSRQLPESDIRQLVDKSPLKSVRMSAGDTLSGQLQKQFKVNPTWTPAMYDSMVSRIVELNGLGSPDSVEAGQDLLVPVIPRAGRPGSEQGLSVTLSESVIGPTVQFSTAVTTSAARTEIQYIKVRVSELPNYALDGDVPQGASGPIEITLGAGGTQAVAQDGVITTEVASRIRQGLSKSATGLSPVLVVVDDAIPDHAEYVRARDFMLEVSKVVREKHGLGESRYYPELKGMPSQLPAADEATLYPNTVMHASTIKASLGPLTQIDPQRRVRVVYIPLAATQIGITPLYKELLYLAELLKIVQPSLPYTLSATADQRNTAANIAESLVLGNERVFVYGPVQFVGNGGISLRSDRSLIEALGIVLDAYSNATAQPHALSFSWTMPRLSFPAYLVDNPYGWKFAAAGNKTSPTQSADFLERELQFAARAAGPKDVVAVLNSDDASGACASNVFDDSGGIQVLSLAFTGRVDATLCGTSFSTPRVAWLVAAREAIFGDRSTVPMPSLKKMKWREQQQQLLLGLRSQNAATVLQRHNLEAAKLFQPAQPKGSPP